MFKTLISCMKPYKKYIILTPAAVIIEVLLEVFIPRLMADIINIGIGTGDINYVLRIGGAMVFMALLSLSFGALSGKFAATAATGFAKEVRKKLFYKIQTFSFANIDRFSTASLVTRLTTDVTSTQNAFMMTIRICVRAPVMLVSATLMAISINPDLSVIFLVSIPFLGAAMYLVSTKAFPRFQAMLKKYDEMNALVQENLAGIRVVKSFVRENFEDEKFRHSATELREFQMRAEKILICIMPLMQFTAYGCMLAVSWLGGKHIIAGNMLTGDLMSFISYIMQILMSLMMISMIFVMLVMSRASVSRIVEILNEKVELTDETASKHLVPKDGSIEFKNVSFRYQADSEAPTLSEINLSIRSGETVGIIGGTGSSKTTLVQLIPRLYDATGGQVIVGGHDVRDYPLQALRHHVAMVLQKNVLFSGTILDNLRWGDENASMEQVISACKAAQAHDFIMSFEKGYDTGLGQGGVNLSGGQKQRLCIARALLKSPKIIILDDSTSAVDSATDQKLREAFQSQFAGTTTLIIAQRIASVENADRIIVLDEGRISAAGTHEQLLRTSEIYREVYDSQKKGVA